MKFREGFVLSIGTISAQGAVEAGEKAWQAGHGSGHAVALALAIVGWVIYRLYKATRGTANAECGEGSEPRRR